MAQRVREARCASRSRIDGELCLRRGRGDCWTQRPHCQLNPNCEFWMWRAGERKSTDRMKRRMEGGGKEERDEHMLCLVHLCEESKTTSVVGLVTPENSGRSFWLRATIPLHDGSSPSVLIYLWCWVVWNRHKLDVLLLSAFRMVCSSLASSIK